MLISSSKKFIYIHVDRTGGTTFSKAFKKYTKFQWSHRFHQFCLKVFGEIPSIHLLKEQSALELRSKIDPSQYESYFKFAMIRNPWEWMVSDFSYRQQNTLATDHTIVNKMTFEEFVKWKLHVRKQQVDFLNHGLSSQFTDENGQIIVDHVGRFENFNEEFNFFCKKVGIKSTIPHLNSSKFDNYQSFYNQETRDLVKEHFALDIKKFGYSF